MRTNIPVVPPAGRGAQRRDRADRRHGRGPETQSPDQVDARAARQGRFRRGVRRRGRAQGQGARSCRAARKAAANIHIGINWLESVAFEHIKSIGEKVLIIGVGNTAMDCCRTSLRLGAKDVKVMARKPRQFFKASAWELEDAEEEHVKIVINRSPKNFVRRERQAQGHELRRDRIRPRREGPHHRRAHHRRGIPRSRRRDPRHRPGKRVPVDRARSRHRVRQVGCAQGRREDFRVDARRRVLRRRRGVRPEEHHLGRGAWPPGGDLDPQPLPGRRASPSACRRA